MTLAALPQISVPDPRANQRAASDPASSVWVNASAGSGKTTILTARVMRLLLEGVKPEKILCLTYTRAGAAEMANRVTKELSKWATCDDDALDADLDRLQNKAPTGKQRRAARRLFARVLACPGGLRIRTIHSFCQEILSRFPLEAGLPPHFSLIDEQDLAALSNEVLDDLLREAAENPEGNLAQALAVLVAAQGEHGFTKMLHEVMRARLTEAAIKAGGEEKLIARIRGFLQLGPEDKAESFRREVTEKISEANLRQLASWLVEGSARYKKRGEDILRFLENPQAQRPQWFDKYLAFFLTKENLPLSDSYVASKEIRACHPEIDALCAHEAMRLQLLLERIEAAEIAEVTESVLFFGTRFAENLATRKAARDVLDYDDLIHFTEALLSKPGIEPWILYKLDNGIDHILVDEAQDTSRAQWNIVQALTAEFFAGTGAQGNKTRTLFVVGDEKQSIFSFQNADPEAFFSLRSFFDRRLAETGKKLEKIGLHTSFRSAPAILRAVDAVFAQEGARKGVSFDPVTHSAYGRDKIGHVEVWPLLKALSDETGNDGVWDMPTGYEEEHDPQAELARQIALKIKGWMTHKELLPGADRPIEAGDIMILLRRRGRFADLMVRALKVHGVPVTGVDRMRLISQLPVMDLLAMLRFVLLPEDDLNLAALLRGPLLGISEEQLMELAIGRKDTLWQSVKSAPAFKAIYDYLSARLNEADFSTPFAFLSQILNASCPANAVSGRKALWARLGDEALDPVEELLNEAQNFGMRHSPSLQNFLHWLTQSDTEIKRELDRGGGQVRIMTVHASKGLEAPIVFLPDTASVPRATDIPKFQWSQDGIPLFLNRQPKSGAARALWQNARDKQLEEYRRLFYVALTRAANRLYICGWQGGKNEGDLSTSWYGLAQAALHPLHQDFLQQDNDGVTPEIIFADMPAIRTPAPTQKPTKTEKTVLPGWALRAIEMPQASPLLSHSADISSTASPDAAFKRGRIIHRLLQSLPDIAPENQAAALARFLAHPRHGLTQDERDEIAQEVGKLLADENFSTLFAADSLAEAPLTGSIDGVPVFRQIDRLCLRSDEVWIVDYKTNRPPPQDPKDIPAAYRRQLNEYGLLLRGIYPGKRVRCFLLWTYAPRLMEIT